MFDDVILDRSAFHNKSAENNNRVDEKKKKKQREILSVFDSNEIRRQKRMD